MTPEEKQKLVGIGRKIAECETSGWDPARVISALLPEPTVIGRWELQPMTLNHWLLLSAQRSPFIGGAWPEDATDRLAAVLTGMMILCETNVSLDEVMDEFGVEGIEPIREIIASHINEAFETLLKMKWPGKETAPRKPGGFGLVLPLYVFLRSTLHETHIGALRTPLKLAFAAQAQASYREGFDPDEATYTQKEAIA